jgi:hypothetical protein
MLKQNNNEECEKKCFVKICNNFFKERNPLEGTQSSGHLIVKKIILGRTQSSGHLIVKK